MKIQTINPLELSRKQRFKACESIKHMYKSEYREFFVNLVLLPSQLTSLDILFIHNKVRFNPYPHNIGSKMIQIALRGKYNHIAIAIINPYNKKLSIFEALPKVGVIATDFNDWIKKYSYNNDTIHIARPKNYRPDNCRCDRCLTNQKLHPYIMQVDKNLDFLDVSEQKYITKYRKRFNGGTFCSAFAEDMIRKQFQIYDYELVGRNPCTLEEWMYEKRLIANLYPLIF